MAKYKILLVEDDFNIRNVVAKYLEKADFNVFEAVDGFEGLSLFNEHKPDLLVLDVMMPGISGFEVLKEVRLISNVPAIMLTAKQQEIDRLKGFDLGADDYVAKPFSPRELVKRVQAIIKRTYGALNTQDRLICGNLVLDIKKQTLYKDDVEIEITAKEYKLLSVFFLNRGQLLSREQLIEDAFGSEYDGFDRNIDSYIKKIRQKIEVNSKKPEYLKTKYGAGYIFGGETSDHKKTT